MPPLPPIEETPGSSSSSSSRGSRSGKSLRKSGARGASRYSSTKGNNRDDADAEDDYDGSADDILALLKDSSSDTEETASASTAAEGGKKVRFARSNAEHHRRVPSLHSSSLGERDTTRNNISSGGGPLSEEQSATNGSNRPPSESFDPTISRPDSAASHNHHHRPSSAVSTMFGRVDSSSNARGDARGGDNRVYDRRRDQFDNHNHATSMAPHSATFTATDDQLIESLKWRHQDEMNAIVVKHREELDRMKDNEVQAQHQANNAGLLKDAVAALQIVTADLKSRQQKDRDDELAAERTRLESLQVSLQRERERLLEVEDDERTKLMNRLESLETARLEHAQLYRKQQSELQKGRDDLERSRLEFAIRVQDTEEKLERKRESLVRDKEHLIDSKEKFAKERADFDESRRMARTELQGADALRQEFAEMQNNVHVEATRLNSLKEQLEHETKALLDREASIDARLVAAEKLDAKNAQTLKDIEARKAEYDRLSAKLQEREERLLYSSIDAMKSRYYQQAMNGMSSATHQQQHQQHQYYSASGYCSPTTNKYISSYRPPSMYPPLSPTYANTNASTKKMPERQK